jgi:alpha-tubulin suppressor-like RCC1 family protein
VSTSIGSATVSFEPPADTGDGAITSFIVTAIDESTGASAGATGSASPITVSPPAGGTFKIRAQAVNNFGPGRLTEFDTGNEILSGAELYSWGDNGFGQLGQNSTVNKSSPVQVGALTTWSQVSAGDFAAACVTTAGTLFTWGRNAYGTLGQGNTINLSSPVQVGALTTWSQVSAGNGGHTACVTTAGTLFIWGRNNFGQLGDGTTIDRSSPVQVGALTNWSQVSAGGSHSACITTAGTLFIWGRNNFGQLGQNNIINLSSPVQVGARTDWAQVSAGGNHTVCVTTVGTLFTWGEGGQGQLGISTTADRSSPVQIGALTNWAQVSAGGTPSAAHTVCVTTAGTLFAWGNNDNGQLGDGTINNKSSPIQVGALTNWAQGAAGSTQTACLTTAGTLFIWGRNADGQLGQNNTINLSSPVQVGARTDWYQVSAGDKFVHALIGVV